MTPDRRNGHGPDITGGVLILDPRDQTKVQPVITDYAKTATDWEYSQPSQRAYDVGTQIIKRLVVPELVRDGSGRVEAMPEPVIAFDNLRNINTLACYDLFRNPIGLNYQITFNTEHFIDQEGKKVWRFGEWGMFETLTHEIVHCWQQTKGKDPYQASKHKGNTHNAEFCAKAESLGLHPLPIVGCHIAPADGVFAQLMKELGVERPEGEIPEDSKIDWWKLIDLFPKPPKGRSSLTKWSCPDCGLNLRVGVSGEIEVACMPCSRARGEPVLFVRNS